MVGETISHYRVLRSVGGGGMGEVYEAEDLKLGRHVALKVISASHKQSPAALQRFEREARASSSLSHPHICTVYDLLEHQGQPVIVMELLEGRALGHVMRDGPIDLPDFMRLSAQIASGLDAAHRAGVVHRDITPANIFVTAHGDAKILDFGLAKRDTAERGGGNSQSETHLGGDEHLTRVGQVVGTVAYMSPEQVRGEVLDHRTDLFSFGVVLYEMATGRRPFEGRTSAMVCDAILHSHPAPVSRTNRRLPKGLQPLLEKALEKDLALRYQSAADLEADLRRLDRAVTRPPVRRVGPAMRWRAALATGVVLGTILVYALWRWTWAGGGTPDAEPRPATSGPGVETNPALSPDGQTIAYTSDESGNRDIWMTDVRGGQPRQWTTEDSNEDYPSWSADGSTLVFESDRDGLPGIWHAPRDSPKAARRVLRDAYAPVLSPDGRYIAFTRPRSEVAARIAVASMTNPSDLKFLTDKADGKWDHRWPAWSPDGRSICYNAMDGVWVVGVDPAEKPRRLNREAMVTADPAWSSDGQFVYYSALNSGKFSLWRQAVSGGTPSRVTWGSGTERSPHVSRDGRILAFSTESVSRHLQFVDLETRRERLWTESSRNESYPALAHDGGAVYFVSDRSGPAGVWRQALSAGLPAGPAEQLTRQDGNVSFVDAAPNNKWLVYTLMIGAERQLWVVSTQPGRGEPVRIPHGDGEALHPAWSPDSAKVVYKLEKDGDHQIWVQPVVDGQPVGRGEAVTTSPGYKGWPSWIDDHRLAYVAGSPSGLGEVVLSDLSARSSRWLNTGADATRVRWRPTLGMLLVAGRWGRRGGEFEIRGWTLDGHPAPFQPLRLGTDLQSIPFDVSADGRTLVYSRGVGSGDIWILEAQGRRLY